MNRIAIVMLLICIICVDAARKKKGPPAWRAIDQSNTKWRISARATNSAPVMEPGDTLTLHCMGIIKKNQRNFWNTLQLGNGKPIEYLVNAGPGIKGTIVSGHDRGAEIALIDGFSHGLFAGGGVKEGETRELDVASDEAFGVKGHKERGITPMFASSPMTPSIVYVFPVPVCP